MNLLRSHTLTCIPSTHLPAAPIEHCPRVQKTDCVLTCRGRETSASEGYFEERPMSRGQYHACRRMRGVDGKHAGTLDPMGALEDTQDRQLNGSGNSRQTWMVPVFSEG